MKREEVKELLKDKFEEITPHEFIQLSRAGQMDVYCEDGHIYFEPKETWPKVFEGECYTFKVDGCGQIYIGGDGRVVPMFHIKTIKAGKEAFTLALKLKEKDNVRE